MNCKKCNNNVSDDAKFCGKCGAEQPSHSQKENTQQEKEQRSFRLDMSKKGNLRALMGIGFLVGLRLLGPLVGSYLLAGIILGVLFAVIDYSFKK